MTSLMESFQSAQSREVAEPLGMTAKTREFLFWGVSGLKLEPMKF